MSAGDEAKVPKRRGPRPRYRVARHDAHIPLTVELMQRLDDAAKIEGRPAYVERVLREHFGMPMLEEQQEG